MITCCTRGSGKVLIKACQVLALLPGRQPPLRSKCLQDQWQGTYDTCCPGGARPRSFAAPQAWAACCSAHGVLQQPSRRRAVFAACARR
jgi:hypothetical protein